jgi:hypothetical protein
MPDTTPSSKPTTAEALTQALLAEDDGTVEEGYYVFELVGLDDGPRLLPLAVNPQQDQTTEIYTNALTPGVTGEVFAEENGIVLRRKVLSGTFGFDYKPFVKGAVLGSAFAPTAGTSASTQRQSMLVHGLKNQQTGLKHLQILHDFIFRAYADAKRDPALATLQADKGKNVVLNLTAALSATSIVAVT